MLVKIVAKQKNAQACTQLGAVIGGAVVELELSQGTLDLDPIKGTGLM